MTSNPDMSGYSQQPPPPAYGQPQPGYPSTVVVQQPQYNVAQHVVRPADYLILSIITIFFCWPMAICAIMYSLNSRSAADANDFVRAESEGRTARNIGVAALIIGVVVIIICIVVPVVVAAAATASICTGYGCNNYIG